MPTTEWPGLIQQLVARPTRAQLVTEDGQKHSVPLREVTLERYVHRLRLDATIPGPLFELLDHFAPAGDRPLLKAVARRAVWENEARREILVRYLTATAGGAAYRLADVVELLKLAETYQPADVAGLLAQIPHWLQVLRQEINESGGGKPFFNERVEELHGGGRDQRRQDNSRVTAKENERAFLERLQQVLAELSPVRCYEIMSHRVFETDLCSCGSASDRPGKQHAKQRSRRVTQQIGHGGNPVRQPDLDCFNRQTDRRPGRDDEQSIGEPRSGSVLPGRERNKSRTGRSPGH